MIGRRRYDDATVLAVKASTEVARVWAERLGCTTAAIKDMRKGRTYKHLLPSQSAERGCDRCQHWHGLQADEPCDLGHQDWREEGLGFGGDCPTWRGQAGGSGET